MEDLEVMEVMEDMDQLEGDWVAIALWDPPSPHLTSIALRCRASLTHRRAMEWAGAATTQMAATMEEWVEAATTPTAAIMVWAEEEENSILIPPLAATVIEDFTTDCKLKFQIEQMVTINCFTETVTMGISTVSYHKFNSSFAVIKTDLSLTFSKACSTRAECLLKCRH